MLVFYYTYAISVVLSGHRMMQQCNNVITGS